MVTATPGADTGKTRSVGRDPYIWHKLHSLSGILPIGVFLVQHLIANSYALRGAQAYNTVVEVYGYLPFVAVLDITVIYLPILYHSIYGFYIMAHGSTNVGSYRHVQNWMYLLQRISGVIAFFYIGFHIWNTSIQKYILIWQGDPNPERAIQYSAMSAQMTNPWMFGLYLVGIIATVFHFSNGIWNFCIRWGVTISEKSQRVSAMICAGIFFILVGMGIWTATSLREAGESSSVSSQAQAAHPLGPATGTERAG